MRPTTSKSLESRLFWAAVFLLLLTGLLYGIAELVSAHGQAGAPSGRNPGLSATWLAFDILEFASLGCLILAALVSVVRTFVPSKPR